MTVGWGIIGIGGHADRRMAPAIQRAEGANLVAVYSRDQLRADEFAGKHGALRGYSELDRLLGDPDVEIIYIGSPSEVHTDHAIVCAMAGKHILVDKPLATTVEDCQKIIDTAERYRVMLATGYNQRYQAAHEAARALLQQGLLGTPVLAKAQCSSRAPDNLLSEMRGRRSSGSGSLLSTATHVIDLLRWLLDDEVEEVTGLSDADGVERDFEELAVASLRFSRGTYAQLDTGLRVPWPTNDVVLHAEHGFLRTSGTILFDTGGKIEVTLRGSHQIHEFRPFRSGHDPFTAEVEHLGRVLREGGEPRASGVDGLEGARVALAIRQSAATGRSVRIAR